MPEACLQLDQTSHRTKARPSGFDVTLKRIALLFGLVLTAEIIWFAVLLPSLPFSKIEIIGDTAYSNVELLTIAGINEKTSFMNFSARTAEQALQNQARIAEALVAKRFPDRLRIEVRERAAVAVALAGIDGRSLPAMVDVEGVVFQLYNQPAHSDFQLSELPVVSGSCLEKLRVGTRLPPSLSPLFRDLDRLRQEAPTLLRVISEIRINERAYEGYELTLYPSHYPVKVKIGPELNEETLGYMMLLLDVLASKGVKTDELDFRTGTATYRAKEVSSG